MKATTIKWIDKRVGTVLCRLFSWLSYILPSTKSGPSKKILFIKLIEQGASVLAYSALKEAIEKVGRDNVYFMVFEENRFILDFLDVLKPENIIVVRNHALLPLIIDLINGLLFLRRQRVDSTIDMEFFSRASAIISYLSGAKKRVGLYSFTSEHPYRGNLISHKIHYNPYIHVSKYYLLLVKALEEEATNEPLLKFSQDKFEAESPRVEIDQKAVDSVQQKIGEENKGKKLVILNPNASDMLPLRKWETAKFSTLAARLVAHDDDILLIFTGVEKERKAVNMITDQLKEGSYINLAGKTTLTELMALYQISSLVVTNDSGPAHFASMFPVKIIVLFGPETPELFAPIGENIHVIYKKLACSPCVNVFNHRFSACTDNICMQNISVEEVFNKAKEKL